MVCTDGSFDAHDQHLSPDYRQDQPHEPRDDLDPIGAEVAHDPLTGDEESITDQTEREKRPDRDKELRQAPRGSEVHRRGDGARAGEYRQRERRDGDLEFRLHALSRVLLGGMVDPGVLAMKHVKADQKHQQSAGDAEGRKRNTKEFKDEFANRTENENDHEGGK